MRCPVCGTKNSGNFCQKCGARLVSGGEAEPINLCERRQYETETHEQPAAPDDGADNYNYPQPAPPVGTYQTNKTAVIITAIVAGAAAVAAIVFGVIVCTLIAKTPELIDDSNMYDSITGYVYEATGDELGEGLAQEYNGIADSKTGLCYADSALYDGVKITDVTDVFYDKYESMATTLGGDVAVEIPSRINGRDVVEIEWLPLYFDGAESIKLVLPDTVKVIRSYALGFTPNLTEVQFGSSLTSIGDRAFIDCPMLTEVTIPPSVTTLDYCGLGIYFDENGIERANPDFVIRGEKGSAAETYASRYGFTFKTAE